MGIKDKLIDIEKALLEKQEEAIQTNRKYMKEKMEELEKMMIENIKILIKHELDKSKEVKK